MAVELATAYISLVPSARGIGQGIAKELGAPLTKAGADAGAASSKSFGQKFGSAVADIGRKAGAALTSAITGTATAAATVAGGVIATSLFKGWDRLTTIQDSTAALTITLGDATAAGKLLDEILGVVRGTPFNLDQFARAGQQLVGFGVSADKVPVYLKAIGEASATQGKRAGEFADRLSTVFGQVAASGQMSLADVWRISDAGVNALAILANSFGVTRDEMKDMISKGAVPAGKALDALAKGIMEGTDGPAGATVALAGTMASLRESLTGAVGGIGAAMARLGAGFLTPFVGTLTVGAQTFTEILDRLAAKAGEVAKRIAESPGFQRFADWLKSVPELVGPVLDGAGKIKDIIAPLAGAFAGLASTNLASALGPLGALVPTISPLAGLFIGLVATSQPLQDAFRRIWEQLAPLVAIIAQQLAPVFASLIPIVEEVTGALLGALSQTIAELLPSLPSITEALVAIAAAFGEILTALAPVIPQLVDMAVVLIDTIGVPALNAIASAVETLAGGISWLADDAGILTPILVAVGAAMVALKVKALALAAAQKIYAVAQWAVNAAMTANPIGILVAALAALVAAVIWAYNNVDWFRNIVDSAWQGIQWVISWAWESVIKPVFNAIAGFITGILIPYYRFLWSVVQAVWGGIQTAISFAWNSIIQPIWNALVGFIAGQIVPRIQLLQSVWSTVWGAVQTVIFGAWSGIQTVFGWVKSGIQGVIDTFWRVKDGIASAFGGLAEAIKAPFSTAFNAIRSIWNSTVGGKGFDIPDWVPGLGGKSFRIPTFHTGGLVPQVPGGEMLAVLQSGEFVLPANVVSMFGPGKRGGGDVNVYVDRPGATAPEIGDEIMWRIKVTG